jgi:hypothetical protein
LFLDFRAVARAGGRESSKILQFVSELERDSATWV